MRIRRVQRLHQHAVQLGHHLGRRAGGRHQAAPEIRVVPRQPGFGEGRHVGQCRIALRPGDGERAYLARLDVRQQHHLAFEDRLHLAADQVVDRRRATLVRHVQQVDAGGRLEKLGGKMRRRAAAGGRVRELAGRLLGERDELLQRARGHARVHRGDDGAARYQADRRKGALRVVREIAIQCGRDGERARAAVKERVAVRRRLCGGGRADGAASARAVVDDDGLAESLGELLADEAADDVGRPARRERHDEMDRLRGIALRRDKRDGQGAKQRERGAQHQSSTVVAS